jgi:hypothetical protein
VGALHLAYAPRRALSSDARLGGAEAGKGHRSGANRGSGRGITRSGGKVSAAWRAQRLHELVWGGDKRASRHPTAHRPRVRAH